MLNLHWPRQTEASMTLLTLRAYSPSRAVQSIGSTAPSKKKNNCFNKTCHPKGPLLSDFLFEPVKETKVLVNQKASHLLFLYIQKRYEIPTRKWFVFR